MSPVRRAVLRTFRSLKARNFRLYLFGQLVSVTGTWMEALALAWLVLQLTGSGVALGFVTALQFAPTLLVGAWGGVMADRFDKRKVLIGTQASFAVVALTLGLLILSGAAHLWAIYALSLIQGLVTAVDTPTRQSFVMEMVGSDDLANAVSLNSAVMTGTRVIGPAIAGLAIATVGVAPMFLMNAVSYVAVIAALFMMEPSALHRDKVRTRSGSGLRDGLRYVWSREELRSTLILMAIMFTLSFNFSVLLPLLAHEEFGGSARTFGTLMSAMGVGSFTGALFLAHRARPSRRGMASAGMALGVTSLLVALAPTLTLELVAIPLLGLASISFMVNGNASLQLASAADMRGRVMALYAVVFLGSTPIGAPLAGWLAEHLGPRPAIGIGGGAALIASAIALWMLLRSRAGGRETVPAASRERGSAEDREPAPAPGPGDQVLRVS